MVVLSRTKVKKLKNVYKDQWNRDDIEKGQYYPPQILITRAHESAFDSNQEKSFCYELIFMRALSVQQKAFEEIGKERL